MKILLFGKNGQVGWELNQLLSRMGEVFALGREDADFSEPEALRKTVREYKPDVIVNAAAYTAVDKAEEEQALAMAVNGIAPGVLAEEAKKHDALMVHYSTDYVFDGENETPYIESDLPNPINAYGRSKLEGEKAIQKSGCHFLIFRTSWVYSSRGNNFFLTIIKLARKRQQLNIVADQIGSPTWAGLIADTTLTVLRQVIKEITSERFNSDIYHLTSRGITSWYGFAEQIVNNAGNRAMMSKQVIPVINPISSDEYPTSAERPKNSSLDVSKIEKKFGLQLPEWGKSLDHFMQTVIWDS